MKSIGIKSIKKIKPKPVYALKTSTATFIADGIYHHNCVGCNMFNQGRLDVYALNLVKEYGAGILEELQKIKHEPPLTRTELEEIIDSI